MRFVRVWGCVFWFGGYEGGASLGRPWFGQEIDGESGAVN